MKTRMKKDTLSSLVNEVIYPLRDLLIKKLDLNEEDTMKFLKKACFLKASLIPFLKLEDAQKIKEKFEKIERNYEINIDPSFNEELINYYNKLYNKWIENHNIDFNNRDIFQESLKLLANIKNAEKFEAVKGTFLEEEFFDFDDEDETLSNMHYEKISAEEFLATNDVDMDIIYDLEDYLDRYFSFSIQEIDEGYIEAVKEILYKLITIFEMSIEFKDLALAFEKLSDIVSKLEINGEKNKLIKMFIDSIMEDLEKWVKTIFINQDTDDIHYLDASLYSSIEQLEILINK